jgi:hypothetical protein
MNAGIAIQTLVHIHISWVKLVEALRVPYSGTMFDALQIEIDNLVRRSAVKDPENFRKREARRCRPNKWSPHASSGQEGDAAAV